MTLPHRASVEAECLSQSEIDEYSAFYRDYRSSERKRLKREAEDKRLRTMRWVRGRRVYADEDTG